MNPIEAKKKMEAGFSLHKLQSHSALPGAIRRALDTWLELFDKSQSFTRDELIEETELCSLMELLLNIFLTLNFVGPFHLEKDAIYVEQLLLPFLFSSYIDTARLENLNKSCVNTLCLDGETFSALVYQPFLIKLMFDFLSVYPVPSLVINNCYLRVLMLFQYYLSGPSLTLKNRMFSILDQQAESSIECMIEKTNVLMFYSTGISSNDAIQSLLHKIGLKLGLTWKFTGVLGKRTKFQVKEVSQLVLEVQKDNIENAQETPSNVNLATPGPKTISLDNEVLLESVQFSEPRSTPELSPIEQAYLLLCFRFLIETQPLDFILRTELLALLEGAVLGQPSKNWSIYSISLWNRSILELHNSKKVERSIFQCQAILDQISDSCEENDENNRLSLFWTLFSMKKWGIQDRFQIEKTLGDVYMSFGAYSSALEIFERIADREKYVLCLMASDRRSQAIRYLTEYLSSDVGASDFVLWNLRGDLESNPQFYEKAFEVSGGNFVRSLRSLGLYYMQLHSWMRAIEYFEKSLEINSLYEHIWYATGCCYIKLTSTNDLSISCDDYKAESSNKCYYDKALDCFSRVIALNDRHKEAWNNLATIHLIRKDYASAKIALKESLKDSATDSSGSSVEDEWKKLDNYLTCCLRLQDLSESVSTFLKIITLRSSNNDPTSLLPSFVDWKILKGLFSILKSKTLEVDSESEVDKLARNSFPVRTFLKILEFMEPSFSQSMEYWDLYADFTALLECLPTVTIASHEVLDDKMMTSCNRPSFYLSKAFRVGNSKLLEMMHDSAELHSFIQITLKYARILQLDQDDKISRSLNLSLRSILSKIKPIYPQESFTIELESHLTHCV